MEIEERGLRIKLHGASAQPQLQPSTLLKGTIVSKPTDLRRLGTILVLGVIASYGVRYVASRVGRSTTDRPTGLIDWEQARTFALRVSQWEQAGIPDRAARREQYARLVERSEPLIAEYLGVQLPEPINRVYVVDRR